MPVESPPDIPPRRRSASVSRPRETLEHLAQQYETWTGARARWPSFGVFLRSGNVASIAGALAGGIVALFRWVAELENRVRRLERERVDRS